MAQTISALVATLEKARVDYYNSQPTMSDAAFDALEDELRKLDPNNSFFLKVGAPAPQGGQWPKAPHGQPMGSLNKAQSKDDLRAWFTNCSIKPGDDVLVGDKCDGISIGLTYVKGILNQAITRGDGTIGEDITRNVLLMEGAVKRLPKKFFDGSKVPDVVHVRGEIVCTKSAFAAHFQGESNPRSTANGTAKRRKSGYEKCSYLTILTYQILPQGKAFLLKSDEIRALKECGFRMINYRVLSSPVAVEAYYDEYVKKVRAGLDYDIDGLVIDLNDTAKQDALGKLGGKPKGAVAFKFPHEEKPTKLKNVRWSCGKTGRITPVAEVEPVRLAGANIVNASLHNVDNIAELCSEIGQQVLAEGDLLLVSRRNDVIPYVEKILKGTEDANAKTFDPPTTCPSCNGKVEIDGAYLICNNDPCEAQAIGLVTNWVAKIGVKFVGEALIAAWIDAGLVEDPSDLYTLDPAIAENVLISGRKAGGSATKAIKNLNKSMTLPLALFVGSLNIENVGRTTAQTIVDAGFDSLQKMAKAKVNQIAAISGLGESTARDFVYGLYSRMHLIGKLLSNGVAIEKKIIGPLTGKFFCLTGFRDSGLEAAIQQAGGLMKSGVSKDLTYLVLQDPTSASGKAKKARDYNGKGVASIDLIDPDAAWKLTGQIRP